MRKFIALLLIIISTSIFGQKLKKRNDKDNKESYTVLNSNPLLKHGNYKKTNYNNTIRINGYYKNGVKDSIWEFYDFNGKLEQKYDFTKKEIIFYKIEDKNKNEEFKVVNGIDTIKIKLERPPLYIGASAIMFENLLINIKYPQEAKENGTKGKVYIAFTVNDNGKTSDHRVTQGIGSGCDEEALRVIKEIPDNWLPGQLNGKSVNVEFVIPVNFQMK